MHLNRRVFLIGGLLGSTVLTPAVAAAPLTIVYIGGADCPPCLSWKTKYKARWMASPEFRKIRWIEVEPPSLKEAYQARFWGGPLEPILAQLPQKSGTPRFLVVQDGQIIDNQLGVSSWLRVLSEVKTLIA
jgi:hypothetical protein